MKRGIRTVLLTVAFLVIAGLGLVAWVRLAPVDARDWHVDLPTDTRILEGNCAEGVHTLTARAGGQAACSLRQAPDMVLARLDAIAMATPRTICLAGSPAEGRMTWQTRSALFGFPDYTTAQVHLTKDMTRLDIIARQRFGVGDGGVNAARLRDWLSHL
jgi:uncharacterized protein (DUF1499 family)